jgi:hypothetical protein
MLRDLGHGLVLRRAIPADTDALVAFNADVLRHQDAPEPDAPTAAWTRDLLTGRHPHVAASDFTVVEDTRAGVIVSSVGLISQTWSYAGVPIAVGQPELIGTRPDHRDRGLVRAQLDVVHGWSAKRGHVLQAIDGIPWFYRQFGYEMALALRAGRSADPGNARPSPAFRFRPATPGDVPFLVRTDALGATRYLVTCSRDDVLWRYEVDGRVAGNQNRGEVRIMETADGQPVGFAVLIPRLMDGTIWVIACEIVPDVAWHEVASAILADVETIGNGYGAGRVARIGFWLGEEHPIYRHAPHDEPPYAWYLRVADLAGFLRHIAPVLERRLAASPLAGHGGTIDVSFYRDGLRLTFADGRLTAAQPWRPPLGLTGIERGEPTTVERPAAMFPGRTFLQLVFGYRSLDDLEFAFPDCLVRTDAARQLLLTLFPRCSSHVWPVL